MDALVEAMHAKRYRGPFANTCDGFMIVTFHGPGVPLEPAWIEPAGNPFGMRVLDCKAFCQDSPMTAIGTEALSIGARIDQARTDPRHCTQSPSLKAARTVPCLLSYPTDESVNPDGTQFVARAMEDLWNVFQFDGYLYFTRSWTGELRYRAKFHVRPRALFVTAVDACGTPPPDDFYHREPDENLPVRQVDFLIKALLYKVHAPAPAPRCLAEREPGFIALFSLMEYGRWGCFPSFEDTTEYRFCLNGVQGRFPHPPENALLPVLRDVEENDNAANRRRLLESLRGLGLYFAFSIPEEHRGRRVDNDTPIYFRKHEWQGRPCGFAYTDPGFRIEPSAGCLAIPANGLRSFVVEKDGWSCVVVNPGGPATCILDLEDLAALAAM
ncbi:MAG: hypothetical protein U0791_19955 [Gemmataceae bacterium]